MHVGYKYDDFYSSPTKQVNPIGPVMRYYEALKPPVNHRSHSEL